MNNFSVGYAEDLKNGCSSHGEPILLNPSRRDTTIIHYSIFIIHSNSKSLNRAINRNLTVFGMKSASTADGWISFRKGDFVVEDDSIDKPGGVW